MPESKYRRVVLKLSGEAFADRALGFGIDSDVVHSIAAEVTKAREVAHDIALHIASAAPRFVSRDDVPADEVERERDILQKQTAEEGKPEQAWPKIVEGKLNGFFKTVALVEQSFVKDQKQTIGALVQSLGDGVSVRRFARVKIGED